MSENKEFYDLLKTLTEEQTFALSLFSVTEKVACKYLTTSQLKELIKTVVDSPLTQSAFNTTCTNVFKNSLVFPPAHPLNVLDRLVFILQTRANSISPTITVKSYNGPIQVNIADVLNKIYDEKSKNVGKFNSQTETEGKIKVTYGVALLDAELQLNEEIYKDLKINTEDPEEMKNLLGDSFVNEISKCIQTITIDEKTLDLSKVTFSERLKMIGTVPASLIQKVVSYIENYKDIIENCLTVEGNLIILDASLFSVK